MADLSKISQLDCLGLTVPREPAADVDVDTADRQPQDRPGQAYRGPVQYGWAQRIKGIDRRRHRLSAKYLYGTGLPYPQLFQSDNGVLGKAFRQDLLEAPVDPVNEPSAAMSLVAD